MNEGQVVARWQYEIGTDDYSLFVIRRPGGPRPAAYLKAEWVEYHPGTFGSVKPMLDGSQYYDMENRALMQKIMDAAWNEGMRPTGFAEIKNQTQAMQNHIDDLRAWGSKLIDKVCK